MVQIFICIWLGNMIHDKTEWMNTCHKHEPASVRVMREMTQLLVMFHWAESIVIMICIHTAASQMAEENIYVTSMQYSPLLAGFAVVMSNGRAAFMTADTLKFEPSVSSHQG